jgi:hypothetical protein
MYTEKTVQAVYEGGVLRPLDPVPLKDRQEVTVTISDEGDIPRDHPLLASPEEWAGAAGDDISLDKVRRALSTIRGSLSETVIDERREFRAREIDERSLLTARRRLEADLGSRRLFVARSATHTFA